LHILYTEFKNHKAPVEQNVNKEDLVTSGI